VGGAKVFRLSDYLRWKSGEAQNQKSTTPSPTFLSFLFPMLGSLRDTLVLVGPPMLMPCCLCPLLYNAMHACIDMHHTCLPSYSVEQSPSGPSDSACIHQDDFSHAGWTTVIKNVLLSYNHSLVFATVHLVVISLLLLLLLFLKNLIGFDVSSSPKPTCS
jgi:hypothetical protein